jgi:hypothetical protein
MNEDQFWQVIERACRADSRSSSLWHGRLVAELEQFPADQIVEWNHIFDRLASRAYTIELMAACYVMNGGAGDDGFYYFRCWLIGMGREVYSRALRDPDSLASVALPWSSGIDSEAEIYAAAHAAWMRVSGEPDTAPYPARNESAELTGDDWDFDDPALMRQHLPKLAAFYQD